MIGGALGRNEGRFWTESSLEVIIGGKGSTYRIARGAAMSVRTIECNVGCLPKDIPAVVALKTFSIRLATRGRLVTNRMEN